MSKVSSSILAANFAALGEEVKKIEATSAESIHFDIMDHHFVPNLTFGPMVIKQLRKFSNKPFNVHIMVENPEQYVKPCQDAGVNLLIFHAEATRHHDSLISKIKDAGMKAGIALNPSTPPNVLEYVIKELNEILVMTVNPGFGGQQFLHSQLAKITAIKNMAKGLDIEIEVDGGVNNETAALIKKAGATSMVAGNYIFSASDYAAQIKILKNA